MFHGLLSGGTYHLTPTEAVEALDRIKVDVHGQGHIAATAVLLASVSPEVREAFVRAEDRLGFWYEG